MNAAASPIYPFDRLSTELVRGTDGRLLHAIFPAFLPLATKYQRAVGYFSSSVFDADPRSFGKFFTGDGRMELVCSPVFSEPDLKALHEALYGPVLGKANELPASVDWNQKQIRHRALAWAVHHNRLSIRIALFSDQRTGSIYHEKIGLFHLRDGRSIAIEGSANESANAYKHNFERILVHERRPDRPHRWVDAIGEDFERLWKNQTPGIEIISLHQAFVAGLLQTRPKDDAAFTAVLPDKQPRTMTAPIEILKRPPRLELRDYQQRAIDAWFTAGGRGVYSMATGSGKTITALATLETLYRRVGSPLIIIIVAPYLNLVDQWIDESRQFGLNPINCSGASSQWTALVDSALYLNQTEQRPILSLVTTNTTFALDPFQRVLDRLRSRTVIVGDEVHNLVQDTSAASFPNGLAFDWDCPQHRNDGWTKKERERSMTILAKWSLISVSPMLCVVQTRRYVPTPTIPSWSTWTMKRPKNIWQSPSNSPAAWSIHEART